MLSVNGRSGLTSWMNCVRKPRLYSAVASVAVVMRFSLSRVSGLRGMAFSRSIDSRLVNRRAEFGLEEVEVAALMRLANMLGEHPAIAAFEAGRGRCPGSLAAGEFLV